MDDLRFELAVGQVVRSKAGRDKGRVFIVDKIIDENLVLIVDGSLRKLDRPKKKKRKHLATYKKVYSEYKLQKSTNEFNDAYVRKLLKPYCEKP